MTRRSMCALCEGQFCNISQPCTMPAYATEVEWIGSCVSVGSVSQRIDIRYLRSSGGQRRYKCSCFVNKNEKNSKLASTLEVVIQSLTLSKRWANVQMTWIFELRDAARPRRVLVPTSQQINENSIDVSRALPIRFPNVSSTSTLSVAGSFPKNRIRLIIQSVAREQKFNVLVSYFVFLS